MSGYKTTMIKEVEMPTSDNEARKIQEIIDDFLTSNQAREITQRLDEEVGQNTDNQSLKVSLIMLRKLYE
tara:strand:- start:488 stop:697 length:210 start_codon:yes stop_codon:yes gene_type:complete